MNMKDLIKIKDDAIMADIKQGMLKVTSLIPINNSCSFALALLWQIFESADVYFENASGVFEIDDKQMEQIFSLIFPAFISEYPLKMDLDN